MMTALAPYLLWIKLAVLAALLAGVGVLGVRIHHAGVQAGIAQCAVQITNGDRQHANACTKAADAVDAAATAAAQAAARAQERATQDRIATIDAHYAQELSDAKAESDRVAAGLRAGTLRLREQWRCREAAAAGVPAAAASVGLADAAAEHRRESASRIVRAADDADAQILALQAVIRADRGQSAPTPEHER